LHIQLRQRRLRLLLVTLQQMKRLPMWQMQHLSTMLHLLLR
jgi:hypothetical protein